MFRHPEETQPATSGSMVTLPGETGCETWVCWPDRYGLDMFVIIEKVDGSLTASFKPGRWLTIREGARWRN
jgi:hypothetical protein